MKNCTKCGKELLDEAVICPACGCYADEIPVKPNAEPDAESDAPSLLFSFIGFLIPLVGLILYLYFKEKEPLKANSAGKGALIRLGISLVIVFIYLLLVGGFTFSFLIN